MQDPSVAAKAASASRRPSGVPDRPAWQGRVLLHSLFESLCRGCFEKQWRRKISACRGIRRACTVMNWQTARAFEFKLMQVSGRCVGLAQSLRAATGLQTREEMGRRSTTVPRDFGQEEGRPRRSSCRLPQRLLSFKPE